MSRPLSSAPVARPDVVAGAPAPQPTRLRSVVRAIRRAPLTTTTVAVLIAVGVLTRTLWRATDPQSPGMSALSYGLPQLSAGRWWTFLTGAFVLPRPEFYLVVGIMVAGGLSWFERRVGTARAAVTFIGTQLAGTVLTAALLVPLRNAGLPWAAHAATQLDFGLSAGAIGVLGAASAALSPIGARRVRLVAFSYLSVLVLKSGLLWDVEHLLAFASGVLAGPRLTGRRAVLRRPTIAAVTIRSGVGLVIASVAVANLVEAVYPGMGGVLGSGVVTHAPLFNLPIVLLELVVALLVADGLRRGRAAAWWIAGVGTAAVLVNTLLNTRGMIRVTDSACCVVILALLAIYRDSWRWRTPEGFVAEHARRAVATVLGFAGASLLMLWLLRGQFQPVPGLPDLLRQTLSRLTFTAGPLHPAGGLARSVLHVAALTWALLLIWLLVPFLRADRGPDRGPREALGQLLRRHGGGSIGWMRTWPAFSTWTSKDGQVAIGYCVVGTVAIAIGDPVGPASEFRAAASAFRRFCHYAGWTPCWFAATSALRESASGWRSTQIGEDTVMDLTDLTFVGKSWQDVRTARNRAGREGITMAGGRLADLAPDLVEQVAAISREWVLRKTIPEMGFTLGTLAHALDPEMRTHIAVDADGVVQGVTTWLPIHRDGQVVGWTLDLMRRRPDGFRPVMEFLIAESAVLFAGQGYQVMSLSVAPLARRTPAGGGRPGGRTVLDRTLDLLSALLEPTYGFTSLLAFKAKFHPAFHPVYLMYGSAADLLAISTAIGRAYLPALNTRQFAELVRGLRVTTAEKSEAENK